MPRTSVREPVTDFGEWLNAEILKRGWERKTLVIKSGVSNTSVNQLIAGIRAPSREMVERLARALVAEDAQPDHSLIILNTGLVAAGFKPAGMEDYDDDEAIAYLRGIPTEQRPKALKVLKAIFEEEDAKDDARNIGKRAED